MLARFAPKGCGLIVTCNRGVEPGGPGLNFRKQKNSFDESVDLPAEFPQEIADAKAVRPFGIV